MWWLLFIDDDAAALWIAKWTLITIGVFLVVVIGWYAVTQHDKPRLIQGGAVVTYDTIAKTDSTITLKIREPR